MLNHIQRLLNILDKRSKLTLQRKQDETVARFTVHMNTQVLEVHYQNVRALDIHGLGGWIEANLKLLGLVCVEQQVVLFTPVHKFQDDSSILCLSHWRTSAGDKGWICI